MDAGHDGSSPDWLQSPAEQRSEPMQDRGREKSRLRRRLGQLAPNPGRSPDSRTE